MSFRENHGFVLSKHIFRTHSSRTHFSTADCGDHVVVINTADIAWPGDEWEKRVYFHHTGYAGGATWTQAHELHAKNKTMVSIDWRNCFVSLILNRFNSYFIQIMEKAVYNSMVGNLKRRYTMQRLHLFEGDAPEEILKNVTNQLRQVRQVPKRLNDFDEEKVKNYPKIMAYPEGYIIEK